MKRHIKLIISALWNSVYDFMELRVKKYRTTVIKITDFIDRTVDLTEKTVQ